MSKFLVKAIEMHMMGIKKTVSPVMRKIIQDILEDSHFSDTTPCGESVYQIPEIIKRLLNPKEPFMIDATGSETRILHLNLFFLWMKIHDQFRKTNMNCWMFLADGREWSIFIVNDKTSCSVSIESMYPILGHKSKRRREYAFNQQLFQSALTQYEMFTPEEIRRKKSDDQTRERKEKEKEESEMRKMEEMEERFNFEAEMARLYGPYWRQQSFSQGYT